MKKTIHRLCSIVLMVVIAAAAVGLPPSGVSAGASSGVPASRFARLRRGINTSHWFAQVPRTAAYAPAHFDNHTTRSDVALIKSVGFDHIRLSVEPAPLIDASDPGRLNAEYLRHLDAAVEMILAEGLALIIDIHPSDEFKLQLRSDDRHVAAFALFWRALAAHYSSRDPERTFLEVINEPMLEDGYRWAGIQARLIRVIREAAPLHTIIATGHRWSSLYEMIFVEPVADPNVIYNFHFYEPFALTHQGATWAGPNLQHFKSLPYPSSPGNVAPLLPALTDEAARKHLASYGEQRWDARKVDSEIGKVAAWAAKYGVRVTCNEFGAYRKVAAPGDRANWLRDVRTTLEKYGFGWTMWDYQGGFSVVNKVDGRAVPDALTIEALGLKQARRVK